MANPSLQIGNSKWAIKKDNLLGYTELGNNIAPVEITMTRASAGTRVNPQGLVETVELLGSELVTNGDFSNGTTDWTVSNGAISIDSGRLKIDGTNGATAEQTVTAVIGKTYKVTYSFTLGTATIGALIITGGNYPTLNAPEGTNTFYTTATQTNLRVRPRIGTDGTMFVDSVSVKESTKNDLARVDYTGSTSSLLAEPQRTNLETTSASGSYGNPPASEILAIAPDGTNTAIRPVPDTSSDRYNQVITEGTYSSGDILTYSWYRKRISTPVGTGYIGDLLIQALINATQEGVTIEIASNINGYDRFSATFSITDGALLSKLRFYFGAIIGNGNSSVAYWGHQLEVGSYATSYIPTDGSTVTRVQDQYTKTGISDKINSEEGVLFAELSTFEGDISYKYLGLSDGTDDNRVVILYYININRIRVVLSSGGTNYVDEYYVVSSISDFHKVALKWKVNDFALWVDGVERATDTSVTVPIGLSDLRFDKGNGSDIFLGKVKQLQVFKTALTDPELATLTTI